MSYNYSKMLPFERSFDFNPSTDWMLRNWTYSIWLSGAYLLSIFGGQWIMRDKAPFKLRVSLATWNAMLAIFSIAGSLRLTPAFFDTIINDGFVHSVCIMDFKRDVVGFWTQLFGLSKAVELIDTAFIVLRKRPLIFLHWYHHITVLIYTWHAYKDHTAAGRWFVYMNYMVHAFMYTYYTLRSLGYSSLPKWVPMTLTSMQIGQMVMGCVVVGSVYYVKTRPQPGDCQQTFDSLYFSFFIYSTYFALFAHLFYNTYVTYDKYAGAKKLCAKQNGVAVVSNGVAKAAGSNGYRAVGEHAKNE